MGKTVDISMRKSNKKHASLIKIFFGSKGPRLHAHLF